MGSRRNMEFINLFKVLLFCLSFSVFVLVGAEPELIVSSGGVAVGQFSAFSKIQHLPAIQLGNTYALGELKKGALEPLIYSPSAFISTVVEGLHGELFLGGSFSDLNGITCYNIAKYKNGEITCLGQGLNDGVHTITVLKISGGYQLLLTGDFSTPESSSLDYIPPSQRMIIWQSDKDGDRWVPLPETLNTDPNSVIPNTDKDSNQLFIGGLFNTYSGFTTLPHAQLITNGKTYANCSSTESGTSCNNIFDGDLTDEKGSIWLLEEGETGVVEIDLGVESELSLIRIANTRFENRGSKLIEIRVDGSLKTMSYYNIFGEEFDTCTTCPLFLLPYLNFQDFYFNSVTYGRVIEIRIIDYVGAGGGIREIEIYRKQVIVENEFNAANSSFTKTGTWTTNGDEDDSDGTYLTALVEAGKTSKLKITPYIPLSGYYSVNADYCSGASCAASQYKIFYATGKSETVVLNDAPIGTFKFNVDDGFKPYVEVTVSTAYDTAGKIYTFNSMSFNPGSAPGAEFRGLAKIDTTNWKITPLNILEVGSDVRSLYDAGDKVFVGGGFSLGLPTESNHYANIVYFTKADGKLGRLAQGGLDGTVYKIIGYDDENIIVCGNFDTPSKDDELFLNNLAMYNFVENTWTPIGYGTDGSVGNAILVKKKLHITGSFTLVKNSKEDPGLEVLNYAVYDFDKEEFESHFISTGSYLAYANNKFYLYGTVSSPASTLSNGISVFDGSSWTSLDRGFNADVNSDYGGAAMVNSVQYLGALGSKLYAGGSFVGKDYLTPTQRVGVFSGGKWENVGSGFNDVVVVLKEVGGSLWAGGVFSYSQNLTSGNIIPLNGLAKFDGTNWVSPGDQLSPGAEVYVIEPFGNNDALVGGSFDYAGMEIGCQNICHWDGSKWNSLNGGANADVNAIEHYKGKFYVGGYFTSVGCLGTSYFAIWDGKQWIIPEDVGVYLFDAIIHIAVDTEDSIFLLDASKNLYRYDSDPFDQFTYITTVNSFNWVHSMQIVSAHNTPTQDVISRGNVLLLTGDLISMCDSTGSVVYFDGNRWYAYGLAIDAGGNPATVSNFYPSKNWSLEAWQIGVIAAGVILFVIIIVLIIVLCICLKNKK